MGQTADLVLAAPYQPARHCPLIPDRNLSKQEGNGGEEGEEEEVGGNLMALLSSPLFQCRGRGGKAAFVLF